MLKGQNLLRKLGLLGGISCLLLLDLQGVVHAQLSTAEHLSKPGYWPTKDERSSEEFVGATVCAKCHTRIAQVQETTRMPRTLTRAGDAEPLRLHPFLSFHSGHYNYEIKTSESGSIYTVTDGEHSLSANLDWAFGDGQVGQSYLFERGGRWFEARTSFFGSLNNVHFTPGRALASPRDLEEAMSRTVSSAEIVRCFKCHATEAITDRTVATEKVFQGVSCEACHGPGGKHAAQMQAQIFAAGAPQYEESDKLIFNPGQLNANDSVDFCGACHSTWWDVRLSGSAGKDELLSPPYRLVGSKCWAKGDARLTCVACHDPHGPRVREVESYDSKCLACHVTAGKSSDDHPVRTCSVAKSKCVSCHMPKVELPNFHHEFTDHRIRIVHEGEPFPS
jgi:Cytochrome c554 and c-prime